jgi:hypothetical protein
MAALSCHGFDGDGGAGQQVPACKDARDTCLIGHRIGLNRSPAGQFHPFCAFQETAVDLLADGRDNHVAFDIEFRTLNRDRSPSAGCIRFTKFILDAPDPGNLSILAQHRNGVHQQFDGNAFRA